MSDKSPNFKALKLFMDADKIQLKEGEIAITNSKGDIVIIPQKYALEAQEMINEGCNRCLDGLVSSLLSDKVNDNKTEH